jgi:acetoacetate decarboxylase
MGTLTYGGVQVALATMPYRMVDLSDRLAEVERDLHTTQVGPQVAPRRRQSHAEDRPACPGQSLRYPFEGRVAGPAELFMVPHVGCPVAALPVVRVVEGRQHLWDMTLSDGEVVYDSWKPSAVRLIQEV